MPATRSEPFSPDERHARESAARPTHEHGHTDPGTGVHGAELPRVVRIEPFDEVEVLALAVHARDAHQAVPRRRDGQHRQQERARELLHAPRRCDEGVCQVAGHERREHAPGAEQVARGGLEDEDRPTPGHAVREHVAGDRRRKVVKRADDAARRPIGDSGDGGRVHRRVDDLDAVAVVNGS